jgi:chitinase
LYQPFSSSWKADYRQIKPLVGAGYTRSWDSAAHVPYLLQDDGPDLCSYEDPQSIGAKVDYVLSHGLGGVAVWDLTMDRVGDEHELLRALVPTLAQTRLYLPYIQNSEERQ